jgi:YggT family protein
MVLDATGAAARFVFVFATVYTLVLILYVLTLWIQVPHSLRPVQRFLHDVCDPYLRFWRRILPFGTGPIDFSPMVAIIALGVASEIVISILNRF